MKALSRVLISTLLSLILFVTIATSHEAVSTPPPPKPSLDKLIGLIETNIVQYKYINLHNVIGKIITDYNTISSIDDYPHLQDFLIELNRIHDSYSDVDILIRDLKSLIKSYKFIDRIQEIKVGFGYKFATGNSNYSLLEMSIKGEWNGVNERYLVSGTGLFKTEGEKPEKRELIEDKFNLDISREHYFKDSNYGIYFGLTGLYDRNIKVGYDFRIGGGASVGYRSAKWNGWRIKPWIIEEYTQDNYKYLINDDENESNADNNTTMISTKTSLATKLGFDIDYEYLIDSKDKSKRKIEFHFSAWKEFVKNTDNINLEGGRNDFHSRIIILIDAGITETFGVRLGVAYDHYSNPPMRDLAEKNDIVITTGITIRFGK